MNQSKISGKETILAMNLIILKMIQYPLLTTNFTSNECNQLVKSIYNKTSVKVRISKKISLAIKYRSKKMFGLGWEDIFIT